MATLTVYPVAGANSPVDGQVYRGGQLETFANLRSGAGTNKDENATVENVAILFASNVSGKYDSLYRAIYCFDTSAIPDDAVIDSAVLSLYGNSKSSDLGSTALHIAGATPASTSALAAADYGQTGSTSFASIPYASFSTSGYNDFTLNAAGIANINKSGISKFSARLGWDIDNNYTGTWSSFGSTSFWAYFADNTGTSKDPKLVITYHIDPPTVTTQAAGSVSTTSAQGNGTITSTGGENATERGIVYSTSSQSLPGNVAPGSSGYSGLSNETGGSFGNAAFSETLSGLSPATTYYARAYAKNTTGGYSYGNEISFTTTGASPTVTTQAVTDNTALTTATGNGNVTSDGGSAITERGVVWSTSPSPTTTNNKSAVSGTTGAFTAPMTGLLGGTLYYVRAYAINAFGTSYGSEVSFTSVDFLNPTNAYADDSDYMTAQADTGDIKISLSDDGGSTYGSVVTSVFTGTESTNTFGLGEDELWGKTWTGLKVNDTNFRLKIAVGTNPAFHIYKTFGFSPAEDVILTGIKVEVKAKWISPVMSVNHIKITIYYGTSTIAVAAGAQAFATDGGADNAGALMVFDGTDWRPAGEGESSGGAVWGGITGTLSDQTDLQTALDAKQASDSDLTAIAGLSPSNDDFMVRNAGAWANRTPSQARTHLGLGTVAVESTVPVSKGGTGATTLTGILRGNGTSAIDAVDAGVLSAVRTYFNADSPATWSKPSGLRFVIVEVQAGGGGGGGAATAAAGSSAQGLGGGGGGYSRKKILAASLGSTETVTIGAAGTAGASGNNAGGNGGNSSFGAHATANGGVGGQGGASSATVGVATSNGVGGTAASGDVNVAGQNGGPKVRSSGPVGMSQAGGGSMLGLGGAGNGESGGGATAGVAATGYGGGGGGAATSDGGTAKAGGAGTQGLVRVFEYL